MLSYGARRPVTAFPMRRGDVYWVDLDPVKGSKANKTRAANRAAARSGRGVVTVVPVTSNVDRVFSFQVLLPATNAGSLSTRRHRQNNSERSPSTDWAPGSRACTPRPWAGWDSALRTHLAL